MHDTNSKMLVTGLSVEKGPKISHCWKSNIDYFHTKSTVNFLHTQHFSSELNLGASEASHTSCIL